MHLTTVVILEISLGQLLTGVSQKLQLLSYRSDFETIPSYRVHIDLL